MNLTCIHCRQPFILNNFNLGKASITCPNSLCGFVARIDTLIENYYGPTLGYRCTAMIEAINRSTELDMIQYLNWKLTNLCREWEIEHNPSLDTKRRRFPEQRKSKPWYLKERQRILSQIQGSQI